MINQKSSLEFYHFPVMLEEVIKICSPQKGGHFIDCTFGGGGYSKKILQFSKTQVVAFDRDKFVLKIAKNLQDSFPSRFNFINKKFSELEDHVEEGSADVVLFDLGLSSIQLNNLDRGFSFKSQNKLDMSMGLSDLSAEDVVNNFSENKLKSIIKIFGEEKEASQIAKNIIKTRIKKKITKVNQLVEVINKSKRKKLNNKINPSTKTFQAIRMFVNKEISELIKGVCSATKILKPGGKILVISFHSLEDKIVKFLFNNFSSNKSKPSRYLPELTKGNFTLFENYKNKIFKPSLNEVNINSPSRSAKLRFAVRNNKKFKHPEDLEIKFKKYLDLENVYAQN